MAKKKETQNKTPAPQMNAYIAGSGVVVEEKITDTLEKNYMPYAMSVIVSRALPEIDGFKPSHRKLLYTMYKMGLLTGNKTKSANIVGQTMKLNPHGDAAIYETMVRMAKGNEALLHPYVESKGNFGKAYSRDMAYAAPRYTEAKLAPICAELFRDIDKDTVDFVPNYDNETVEPTLLPATFPSILVNSNVGIAVSMASAVCSFNLTEICEGTIGLIKDPEYNLFSVLKGPDFPGGGILLYDKAELDKIYSTGRGSVRVRSRYHYDKSNNCLEITEIPPTATVEAIMDKIVDLIKLGKIREISDMRDETDLGGLKLTIDCKRGTDPEKLMQKLFRMTPLEDSFSCNFNVLIAGSPRVLGVRELLEEWTAFRRECVRRGIYFDLQRKKEKLHLLQGLKKILLDIDKAVKIVRETEEEVEVIPNLMIGFGIDEVQAEYVAEIKLRHLNREYILKRTEEIESLTGEIAEMEDTLKSPRKVDTIIVNQLRAIAKEYGAPRKTEVLYEVEQMEEEPMEEVPDYPVRVFFTREGYFKKITPQSLRMSGEQKLKEGDAITQEMDTTNAAELMFFTNLGQVYKSRVAEFEDTKASVMGDYVASKLGMDTGEVPVYMALFTKYEGYMLFIFENGKAAKVDMASYETKTRRKKLTGAFSTKSPLVYAAYLPQDTELLLRSSASRMLIFHTAMILSKAARDTQGVQVMTLSKKGARVVEAASYQPGMVPNDHRLRTKNLPATGGIVRDLEVGEQLQL